MAAIVGLSVSQALAGAPVASLTDFSGKVLIDSGKGFAPAAAGLSLAPKTRIFVGKDSAATLSYPDCAVALAAGSVVTVPTVAPCEKGSVAASLGDAVLIEPVWSLGYVYNEVHYWYFGAIAAVAVVAGVVVVTSNKKDNPVSAP